jgi:hypothetical protein
MGKGLKVNMNYVNCALIVVVLILVVICCFKKPTEGFEDNLRCVNHCAKFHKGSTGGGHTRSRFSCKYDAKKEEGKGGKQKWYGKDKHTSDHPGGDWNKHCAGKWCTKETQNNKEEADARIKACNDAWQSQRERDGMEQEALALEKKKAKQRIDERRQREAAAAEYR